jgi:hypothetical protein
MGIHSGDFFGRKRKILIVNPEVLKKVLRTQKKVKIFIPPPPPPNPVPRPPVDEFWRKPAVNKTPLVINPKPLKLEVEVVVPEVVPVVPEKPLSEKEKKLIAFLRNKLNCNV